MLMHNMEEMLVATEEVLAVDMVLKLIGVQPTLAWSHLRMVVNSTRTVNLNQLTVNKVEEVGTVLAVEPMDHRTGVDSWGH